MMECAKVFVEGNTEVLLLKRVYNVQDRYSSPEIIASKNGKDNVITYFKNEISIGSPREKGNVCYLIDGDEEGFEVIYDRLKRELKKVELKAEKPYIKVCGDKGCHILIVIGKKEEDYKGCLETLLNEVLNDKVTSEVDEIINRILSFMRRKAKLSTCDEEKIKFYERVLLLSSGPSTLYMNKNFVDELLKLVDPQIIKQILGIEIKPPSES